MVNFPLTKAFQSPPVWRMVYQIAPASLEAACTVLSTLSHFSPFAIALFITEYLYMTLKFTDLHFYLHLKIIVSTRVPDILDLCTEIACCFPNV